MAYSEDNWGGLCFVLENRSFTDSRNYLRFSMKVAYLEGQIEQEKALGYIELPVRPYPKA